MKRALARADPSDPGYHKGLNRIASKLVDAALAGESWAIQEIANRLDGKPSQSIQLDTGKGSYVVMIPVAQDTAEQWEQAVVAEQAKASLPKPEPVMDKPKT